MKIKTFTLALAIGYLASGHSAVAQENSVVSGITASQVVNQKEVLNTIWKNNVPSRALRHFEQTYQDANIANWELKNDGSVAVFYESNQQQLVYYTKRGNWIYTVRNYYKEKLPAAVARAVYEKYCGYEITHCSHIEGPAGVAYILSILKDDDLKTVRVENDEISVVKEYRYAGVKQ